MTHGTKYKIIIFLIRQFSADDDGFDINRTIGTVSNNLYIIDSLKPIGLLGFINICN